MNSVEDFARLRPEATAASDEQLESIWNAIANDEPAPDGADEQEAESPERFPMSRRFTAVGAAAAVLIGVVAIATFANRAEAPPVMSEQLSDPADVVTAGDVDVVTAGDVVTDAGEPPLWGATEDEWRLVEFDDRTNGPVDMVRLFAGPEGLATSWVAVVNGMSEPLLPIGTVTRSGDSPERISTQRVATVDGSAAVIGAGVSDAEAMSVFRAARSEAALPDGFVESPSADAAVRTIRYRFENDAGSVIEVETTGGGIPSYDGRVERWGSEPDVERVGADESAVLLLDDDDRTVIARTGFWVTTISADAAVVADVELVSAEEWETITANPVAGFTTLAVGDQVMLGAATQLTELGFVVDAAESRSFVEGLDVIRDLVEEDRLPETLVIHLGNNGSITEALATELGELVADVDSVLLLTSTEDVVDGSNALVVDVAASYSNMSVLHWDVLAEACEGDCFYSDDLHLKQAGATYYADLIAATVEG